MKNFFADAVFRFNRKSSSLLCFYRNVRRLWKTKAFKSERRPETLGLPDRGVKGNFRDCSSRFLRISSGYPSSTIATSVYRDFADTIARKAACGRTNGRVSFFLFLAGRMCWSFRRDEKERIWKNITRSNGRFAFPVSSTARPWRKADG